MPTLKQPSVAKTKKAPAIKVTGIDHVVLHVADVERSKCFYRDVLRMTLHHDFSNAVFLNCGKQRIALFAADDPAALEAGVDMNHLAFAINAGYDAVKAALEAQGIAVRGRQGDPHCLYFEDPDGHQLQIMPRR
jgi:metallothiol transferase